MIGTNRVFGLLNKSKMQDQAETLLADLEINVNPTAQVSDLSGGQRQLVAISRMMLTDPEIVILDEPTSALSVEGADRVLELIQRMSDQGISVIHISHNLEYIQQIADRIMIFHRGKNSGTVDAQTTSRDEIVSRMIAGHPDENLRQQTV